MNINLPAILIGLFGISLVVTIHEFGHFVAARLFGIKVKVFSIGWGPRLWGIQGKETEFRISMIPLGGFCRMQGEEDMQTAILNRKETVEAQPGSFYAAKAWQRMVVAFAGPLFNIVTAVLFLALAAMPAQELVQSEPRIALLSDYPELLMGDQSGLKQLGGDTSPASLAGLKSGDLIRSIDGKPTVTYNELVQAISENPATSLRLEIERGGQILVLDCTPVLDPKTGRGRIGIASMMAPIVRRVDSNAAQSGLMPGDRIVAANGVPAAWSLDVEREIRRSSGAVTLLVDRGGQELSLVAYPNVTKDVPHLDIYWEGIHSTIPGKDLFTALGAGFEEVGSILRSVLGIFRLFSLGLEPTNAVSGPIRTIGFIGDPVSEALKGGLDKAVNVFVWLSGAISVALFFGNLLPIPALDGGQILLCLAEIIKRRPIRIKTIQIYNMVGFFMVMAILGLAITGDFLSLN